MTGEVRAFRAARLWLPTGVADDATVVLHGDAIAEVRPGRVADGPPLPGLVVPGLINAHTHLELSDRRAPPATRFVAWFDGLRATPSDGTTAVDAARAVRARGTAFVWDVSNTGTRAALDAAGLAGVVQREVLGLDEDAVPAVLAALPSMVGPGERPTPHALFSTAPAIARAAVAASPLRATIHVGESADELEFLRAGTGPHADLLDRLGRRWRWWTPPGAGPYAALDHLGLLGPQLLLVHGIWATDADRALVRARGAALCLCPRSNLHVAGALPDAAAWWRAGVPLVLGTDSLASNADLDVLAEIPVLAAHAPDVPPAVWLGGVTHAAAAALGARGFGEVAVGARPGLLHLPSVRDPVDLTRAAPAERTWLVFPGLEAGRVG